MLLVWSPSYMTGHSSVVFLQRFNIVARVGCVFLILYPLQSTAKTRTLTGMNGRSGAFRRSAVMLQVVSLGLFWYMWRKMFQEPQDTDRELVLVFNKQIGC